MNVLPLALKRGNPLKWERRTVVALGADEEEFPWGVWSGAQSLLLKASGCHHLFISNRKHRDPKDLGGPRSPPALAAASISTGSGHHVPSVPVLVL